MKRTSYRCYEDIVEEILETASAEGCGVFSAVSGSDSRTDRCLGSETEMSFICLLKSIYGWWWLGGCMQGATRG